MYLLVMEKKQIFFNISNERPVKIVEGISCKFTEFTNEDSVGVTPATPKAMSVAVSINRASQLRNLRIMVSKMVLKDTITLILIHWVMTGI